MYTWIIYDIRKDNARRRVAKRCRQMGLSWVQKSVFLGRVKKKTLLAFRKDVPQLINLRTDALFIVPMSRPEYRRVVQFGRGFDRKKLVRANQVLFF